MCMRSLSLTQGGVGLTSTSRQAAEAHGYPFRDDQREWRRRGFEPRGDDDDYEDDDFDMEEREIKFKLIIIYF